MELSGSYFEYNGTTSRKYRLVFGNVETEQFQKLNGDVKTVVIFDNSGKRNYIINESYEDSHLEIDAEIVTDDGQTINRFERREIEKWLFHKHTYCKLYMDMDCDIYGESYELVNGVQKRLYLNCRLINPEKIEGNGGLIGYRVKIECDSCMAWQDEVVCEYILENDSPTSSSVITVNVDTDLHDYVYPKVTIQTGATGGNIQIINASDNMERATKFVDLTQNITFTMRGDGVNYVSGQNYQKFSSKNFIRLLDGENIIHVTGDVVKITFEFQNRRYL